MFRINLSNLKTEEEKSIEVNNFSNLYYISDEVIEVPSFEYADFFDNLDTDMFVLLPYDDGEDFVFQYIYPELINSFGLNFIGQKISTVYSKFPKIGLLEILKECYEENKKLQYMCSVYKKNTLMACFKITYYKSNDKIIVSFKDEVELNLSIQKERSLLNNSIQGVLTCDFKGYVNYINKSFLDITGYSEEEAIGKDINSMILEHDSMSPGINNFRDTVKNLISGKLFIVDSKVKICCKKGIIWLRTHSILTNYKSDNIQITAVDITKEIEQEELIKELQLSSELIQDVANIGITFKKNNKLYPSKGIYSIYELDSNIELPLDFFINSCFKEDKERIANLVNNLSPKNPITFFQTQVKTHLANEKFIDVYIKNIYGDNNDFVSRITLIRDISDMELIKHRSITLMNVLKLVEGKSKFSLLWWNRSTGHEATEEFFNILEIDDYEGYGNKRDILTNYIAPQYKDLFFDKFNEFITGKISELSLNVDIITEKNNEKSIFLYVKSTFERDEITSYVGYIQDVTDTIKETRLLKSNLKETELLLDDKNILIKEVHHRVKNNLQIILSLINLNLRFTKGNYEEMINDIKTRINAMALIHEKIYNSSTLSSVNIKSYINSIVKSLFVMYSSDISFHSDIEEIEFDMETAIPIGLMINELLNNTIKYAFPKEPGSLYITLKNIDGNINLIFEDDGIGLPDDFSFDNDSSLGLTVVYSLIHQIDGTIEILNKKGAAFKLVFPFVN